MIKVPFLSFDQRKRALFINSLSGFKSANLIATRGNKNSNLSIISSAFHLGADPALMGLVIRPDISPRHTLINIRENGFCTLNHINQNIVKKAHQTSARYPADISEFDEVGLTEEYLDDFQIPFVKESEIKFSLSLSREINIEENGTHLLIFNIKDVYLPMKILNEDGFVDIEAVKTITVSSLDSYHETKKIGRLSYAKPGKNPEWIKNP